MPVPRRILLTIESSSSFLVRDCEAIRKILLADKTKPEDQKWSVIGQSFGGFCSVAYLSIHPEGLKEVFITGGLPPLVNQPDEVYRRTAGMPSPPSQWTSIPKLTLIVPRIVKVIERNKTYYEKYPQDVKRVCPLIWNTRIYN